MKLIVPFVLLFILSSCNQFGDMIKKNNTCVYYREEGLRKIAIRTIDFLDKNELTNGSFNTIQITRDTMYNVRIVMTEDLAFNRALQSNFKVLGESMADAVFDGSEINLQLCDSRFRLLKNIPIIQSQL